MLSTSEIHRLIQEDATSERKQFARVGERYYEGDHDIRQYRIFYYDANGTLQEDKTRANIRIPHPFFTELVDQQVQYMLSGKDGFMRSGLPELQDILDEYFNLNEDFNAELYDLLTGAAAKGFEYFYAYKGADDKLKFQCADALGVVEVRAKDTDDGCEYVIYWYVDRIEKGHKKIKRIQVWDAEQTWYFVQEAEGEVMPDDSVELNPRPHTLYTKDDSGDVYFEGFGFIPFFRLDNCRKQFSGLKPIKDLIDDYDLMSCGLSNNIQDAAEYLVVVKGFQGDDMEELMRNVKTKKHIGVDSEDSSGVEFKTVEIPHQARQTKLELDEKNIYRFGMGFNSAQMGDGNVTNVVIKSRYALLDLKCNKLEIRLKQFLRKILKIVLKEINEQNGTDYQQRDVDIVFEREVMTNAADNALIEKTDAETEQIKVNTVLSVVSTIDDETVAERLCELLDLEWDEVKGKLPKGPETGLEAATAALEAAEVTDDEPTAAGDGGFLA